MVLAEAVEKSRRAQSPAASVERFAVAVLAEAAASPGHWSISTTDSALSESGRIPDSSGSAGSSGKAT